MPVLPDDETMAMIRNLVSKGYVVTGHGWQFSNKAGWFHIERYDGPLA